MVGGCKIQSLMGQGALGAVYKAQQLSLDRPVAIKILTATNITSEAIKELLQEGKTLAKMNHPNVVKVIDVGVQGTQPFIVMEHLEGETLQKRLERARRLPFEAVLKLASEIAQGLHAAHQTKIVHRDLKPSNIFLRPSQKLKIIDFGLAHHVAGGEKDVQKSGGTPEYMAPEQWNFTAVDGRTDLYALGILIYRMISGKVPFTAARMDEMMQKHLKAPLPLDGFSAEPRAGDLFAVVKVLTSKKPEGRYQSADVVIADLERIAKGQRTRAAEKFGLPRICNVCETVAPPDATICDGCKSSIHMQQVKIEDLLPDEPPPETKRPMLPRDLRKKRLPPK